MAYSTELHTRFYHRYHVVWATKYRHKVLEGAMRERIREIIRQACAEMGVHIVKDVLASVSGIAFQTRCYRRQPVVVHLAVEDVDHSRIKANSPDTNGICERFHRTIKNEFYDIAFRKKLYRSLESLGYIATAKYLCKPSEKCYTSLSRRRSKRMTNRTMRNTFSVNQAEYTSDQVGSLKGR